MDIRKILKNGGGASYLSRKDNSFGGIELGRNYFLDDALTSGSAIVSKTNSALHIKVNKAFTLAEVLITLGIIGIVAALTIPTLISNYTKKQTLTKLKQTYSIMSQALTMAQVEHGDTTTWEVSGITGTNTGDANFNRQDVLTTFAQKYFIPYIKVAKDYGYNALNEIGYEGPYDPVSNIRTSHGRMYTVLLSNNALVCISLGTHCYERDENDNCTDQRYTDLQFITDINGFQKPNIIGKDVFYMIFNIREKAFQMFQYGTVSGTSSGYSREDYLNLCASGSAPATCGQLIFMDGWQIKDDYPWF